MSRTLTVVPAQFEEEVAPVWVLVECLIHLLWSLPSLRRKSPQSGSSLNVSYMSGVMSGAMKFDSSSQRDVSLRGNWERVRWKMVGASCRQDNSASEQDRSKREQDRSKREQDRSKREQDRSKREQDRSKRAGPQQERTGPQQERAGPQQESRTAARESRTAARENRTAARESRTAAKE